MTKTFYVYEHWRPDTDLPFYVGKGCGRRARRLRSKRNPHHQNVVNKVLELGLCVEVRMVGGGMTEDQAFALEKERISFWKSLSVVLTNQNEGGEGGRSPNDETRAKIKAAAKKRGMPSDLWKKSPMTVAGVKHGPYPPERGLKISLAKKGKMSAESKEKIGAATRLRWTDPEYRLRHGLANRHTKSGSLITEGEMK